MKKFLVIVSLFLVFSVNIFADQWVNGHHRYDGTWVKGYYRSTPDGNPYNNFSFPGNVNSYTGKRATGRSDSYLRDHGYLGRPTGRFQRLRTFTPRLYRRYGRAR